MHALMNRKPNRALLTFLVMLATCDFHDSVFCSTTPRLTTSFEKGVTSPPSETPGRFKAFICLTAWLDPKIIALVLLAFNLRQLEIAHVQICSAAAVIAARPL